MDTSSTALQETALQQPAHPDTAAPNTALPNTTLPTAPLVPGNLLFVWFGAQLPLFAELAMRSAATHNPECRVVLLASGLTSSEQARLAVPGLTVETLHVEALVSAASKRAYETQGRGLDAARLKYVWERLRTPAARANLVRLLYLFAFGGIYLDTDTLTLRSFASLREQPGFCGMERLLWPKERLDKRSAYFWLTGPALTVARKVLSRVPGGHLAQAHLNRHYALAVNNAVLGFKAGHPALLAALDAAVALPTPELSRPFRLGTHLLQQVLQRDDRWTADGASQDHVQLLDPEYFYPLGPVTSNHYFRETSNVERVLGEVIGANTHVIHWYASVSDLSSYDATRIFAERQTVPFAHICAPYLMSSQTSSR